MLRVGLTGGIGSGKSRVATIFAQRGAPVIDTDHLARAVLDPGQPLLAEIFRVFGEDLRRDDGSLDRAALRARVFRDPALRARLEAITHPAIGQAMEERIAGLPTDTAYVLLVIPLLVEVGWRDRVDRVLVIDCPEPVQVERVMARDGIDEETAWTMVRAQASRNRRLQAADDVIDNSAGSGTASLTDRVLALDHLYRRLAA
ncbi:dephospho-CoA kinase [Thioalkalivibrio sp.]|uniref:dephospho-CoA kinase n=1 Tax=Thioalkalivibrio sp. TaxID=2093813 RepID=UPI0012D6DAEA|nr:dephospho-CoA kinase [Thioalkalivibrio sp.]TVP79958.1 MAG: dephospho-CoA kinase [Thioalkalivibrio sp.]